LHVIHGPIRIKLSSTGDRNKGRMVQEGEGLETRVVL